MHFLDEHGGIAMAASPQQPVEQNACSVCGQLFAQQNLLMRHMMRVHEKLPVSV
jgi:hypothetical protein